MNGVVVVTGGSRGLGRATVLGAAAKGRDVAFTWRSELAAAEETLDLAADLPGTCRAYPLDVRDSAAVDAFGDAVVDDFDAVGGVVCNAAVNRDGMAIGMSDEDWHDVLQTNLSGSFYVTRRFLPELLANGGGRVVLVSSISAQGMAGMANYSASKAGLMGLGKALAKEYGPKGINTNIVVPGFFDTDMTRQTMPEFTKDFWRKYCPARRMGKREELADVVTFLLSDQSSFVNGQSLGVTGGLNETP